MKRKIKYRAWIPDLGLMLYDVTLYADGMMGMCVDDFQSYIDRMPKHIQFINDGVYHADDDHFDLLLTVLQGEDWIWIDEGDFVPLQYVKCCGKNEIYEGDVLRYIDIEGSETLMEVKWIDYSWNVVSINWGNELLSEVFTRVKFNDETLKKVGNIYENPELRQ